MKSFILSESATRREYKRRWKALERARNNGLDTELIEQFYLAMVKKGYTQETMRAVIYCAGRDGVFGLIKQR